MRNIVVVGASEYAKVVVDIIEKRAEYTVCGYIDSAKPHGYRIFGQPVLGSEHDLPGLIKEYAIVGGVMAIGDNWDRHRMADSILSIAPEFTFLTAIHPSACLGKEIQIGRGAVLMAAAVVNSASRLGDFTIINTNASVDHDNIVGDYASLAPGVTTGGNVTVDEFTAISLGANVIHGISIGPHAVIGAGATVVHDIPGYCVAWGTPARVVRSRKAGERYL
jgi:sugar O-acyltransferase (sialic acid O-acetyltransferase NeuD family)